MSSRRRRQAGQWAAAVCMLALLAGCAGTNPVTGSAAPARVSAPAPTTHVHVQPSPSRTTAPAHHTAQPSPSPHAASGPPILPNAARTPGAINPAVTPTTLNQTICLTGYTSAIRPPESYTYQLKVSQLASGYAYRGDMSTGDYEEDHLIPLELGGSPTAVANLWPEPYDGPGGAHVKDLIENQLHDLVCSGRLALAVAQQAIASNWWNALQRYGGETWPHVYVGRYN